MKRLLIVSPHFPPVNAPDMHRIRTSLPTFVQAGWEVTVLTVADPTPAAPVEQELLASLPAAVRIERARCLPRSWTRCLGIGNVALRALPFLFLRGHRILRRQRFDAVYFSTTQFIVLPFGRLWRALHGVPYVIDLQDPWVTDHYERTGAPPPGGWKYRVARFLARALEGWALRRAGHLITVSAVYGEDLRRRHPELAALPVTEIPFGAAQADLDHLRATSIVASALLPAGRCRLVFAGALGPGMLPMVEAFLAGFALARRRGLDATVHFFGTNYAGPDRSTPLLAKIIARHGLDAVVSEQPGRLPYFEALRLNLAAEINLLFGSTDLGFTPSKLLTLAATGRPLLALAPAGSALIERLRGLGLDCLVLPPRADLTESAELIAATLQKLDGQLPAEDATLRLAEFTTDALAKKQSEILLRQTA